MKPKLIILNGPCGVGKSTIAEMYKNEHPMTLMLDIDDVRRFMGSYKEYQEQSREQMYILAYAMAEAHLRSGYDVIIPKYFGNNDHLVAFEKLAINCNATFFEFALIASKEDAILRAVKRGFKPGGLLQEAKLEKMYDELVETLKKREKVIYVQSEEGNIEKSYEEMISYLKS